MKHNFSKSNATTATTVTVDFLSLMCRKIVESGQPIGVNGLNYTDGDRCCLGYALWSKDGEKCIATTSFLNIDPECEIAKVWTTLVKDVLPSMFEEYWGYIPYIEADNAEDIHQQLEKISEKRGDIHHFVKMTEERAA